jgi:hypothetical protein
MDDNLILAQLKKIGNFLGLLSVEPTIKLLEKLKDKKILSTKQRIKMFLLMDGQRTTPEIALLSGAGQRAAQLFIKELEKRHFIKADRKGRATIPIINYEKIVEHLYLDK